MLLPVVKSRLVCQMLVVGWCPLGDFPFCFHSEKKVAVRKRSPGVLQKTALGVPVPTRYGLGSPWRMATHRMTVH